jgi:hypothetical protein
VLDLLVTSDNVKAFVTTLEADFGSTTATSAMHPSALLFVFSALGSDAIKKGSI